MSKQKSPFEYIPTFTTGFKITKEFTNKWALKFYLKKVESRTFQDQYEIIKSDLNEEIVEILLGDTNWRSRKVGAIFSIIKSYNQFEKIIGNHLLKSEVCYAGRSYALALAHMNTESSIEYLVKYLNYYLTRHDLDFDQVFVMQALVWLDKKNESNLHEKLLPLWHDFIDPRNHEKERSATNTPEYYPKGPNAINHKDHKWITETLNSYYKLK